MDQQSSIIDIIVNDDLFYEKVSPFLFPDVRNKVFNREPKSIIKGTNQIVIAIMVVGIPNEKNIRDYADYINGLWKVNAIAGIGFSRKPFCKELPMENKRRRFLIQSIVYSPGTPEEIIKNVNWKLITAPPSCIVVDSDKLPGAIITNPYSPEEDTPDLTQEDFQKEFDTHAKKKLEDYVKDPAVIEQARTVANEINESIKGNNWITLDQITKKTSIKQINEAFNLMHVLCLTGFAVRKDFAGIVKYKLTLSSEDRIALIQEQIDIHQKAIDTLRIDIEREQAKIDTPQ